MKPPKVLTSLLILGTVSLAALAATNAFFSDTETSSDNLLQAGELDLKIDNRSYYNGTYHPDTSWDPEDLPGHLFFDFDDLKPSDYGEDTISLDVANDAWACMSITQTADDDVTCPKPELEDDQDCTEPGIGQGELGGLTHFAFWADDGDNVYEDNEEIFQTGTASDLFTGDTWTLADAGNSIWPTPGPIPGNQQTRYIGKFWCLGSLEPSPLTQSNYPGPDADNDNNGTPGQPRDGGFTCDGEPLDNATQTDLLKADIQFTAVQSRHNLDYLCIEPSPTPIPCTTAWANSVESSDQGLRKDGSPVLPDRSDPNDALVAESSGTPYDSPVLAGTFYSLGFKNSGAAPGGQIVVSFSSPVFNGPGDDLRIFEVTGGSSYPDENVRVEASPDNSTWTLLSPSLLRDGTLDLGALTSAQYIRITDVSNIAAFESTADGYDLDGVQALCAVED
jgi:predicted ribosomally synthesized peptide with SipW-like signal peptide